MKTGCPGAAPDPGWTGGRPEPRDDQKSKEIEYGSERIPLRMHCGG